MLVISGFSLYPVHSSLGNGREKPVTIHLSSYTTCLILSFTWLLLQNLSISITFN